MKKENLVIVHSFPTNSLLLRGLIDYLNRFFDTHFIDLPGFTKETPPLKRISLDGFSQFVETKIRQFNFDSYIVAGISFGFMVVNHLAVDEKCKGVLGIVPYFGPHSLRMRPVERWFWSIVVRAISRSGLSDYVWNSFIVRQYFMRVKRYRPEVCSTIIEQVDARTFFDTASLLLTDETEQKLYHPAYVLLPSRNDQTVDYDHICRVAVRGGKDIQVICLDIDHYPQDVSRSYFEDAIPFSVIDRLNQIFSAGL